MDVLSIRRIVYCFNAPRLMIDQLKLEDRIDTRMFSELSIVPGRVVNVLAPVLEYKK